MAKNRAQESSLRENKITEIKIKLQGQERIYIIKNMV